MTQIHAHADTSRHSVDVQALTDTVALLADAPELGEVRICASNRWIDGDHNRSDIPRVRWLRCAGHDA